MGPYTLDSRLYSKVYPISFRRAKELKIGEVARAAGLGVHAVRFYEREGLIKEPARRPSGYREYSPDMVLNLRFIRRAKELGFSLKGTAELLSLETDPEGTAAEVKKLAEAKLEDIESRIRALQRMRRALRKVTEECPGRGPTSGCSILRTLTVEEKS